MTVSHGNLIPRKRAIMLYMNDNYFKTKNLVVITMLVFAAVLFSIAFLDRGIALGVMQLIRSSAILHRTTANMPDLLFLLVCIGTAIMWADYFFLTRRKGHNEQTQFLRLAATATPFAFLLKSFLKFIFGRINTRAWLAGGGPIDFQFFHGTGERGAFPSGHMMVFTAFFAAVWCFYPRYRPLAAGLLFLLGAALIATDYHFLSDVIAGAYAGLLVTLFTRHYLIKSPPAARHFL